MSHGLDLLAFVRFLAKNTITQGALQAYIFLLYDLICETAVISNLVLIPYQNKI